MGSSSLGEYIMAFNNFSHEDFEGFAYLDYNNLAVSWNIARGSFLSPSELPSSEYNQSFLSVAMAGMLSNTTPERLYSELAIDKVRETFFPKCVSRLRGFFVFDEIESISRFWNCNTWGGHFSDNYLSDVGVAATRSTRVDSNWISQIVDIDGRLKHDWFENTLKYWKGDEFPSSDPIWERIVEGYLTVWSPDIRKNAVLEINAVWPQSMKLLAYSCLCAAYGSPDGMIFPYLMRDNNNNPQLTYISRMVQANDKSFIEAIIENAKKMPFLEVNLKGAMVDDEDVRTPDLTFLNVSLTSEDKHAFADFVNSIKKQ